MNDLKVKVLAIQRCLTFFNLMAIAHQTSLSMGLSQQEYWSGLLFPSPGDIPDPEIEPRSHALHDNSSPSEPPGKPMNDLINFKF